MKLTTLVFLTIFLSPLLSGFQTPSAKAQSSSISASASSRAKASESEITAAKAPVRFGSTWKPAPSQERTRVWAAHKNGKFMTEAEAKKAGSRESKRQ